MSTPLNFDYLIRLKNAYMAGNKVVTSPSSKYCLALAEILKRHHFIADYSPMSDDPKTLQTTLSYSNARPAISGLTLLSKPGRRLYSKSSSIPWGKTKNSLIIISTSSGLMSQREAVTKKLGGELVAEIN
ncbi:MAG: 30S ribosomal protein S8 [Candidatus Shapirobacteria bacterium]